MKKIHVTLRRKALKSGRISLYLDFFPAVTNPKTGETYRREFLKLYLIPKPKNAVEKNTNSESLRRAEFICSNRLNELNKQQIYTPFELELLEIQALGETSFMAYFKKLADKRIGNNAEIWKYSIIHFENFLSQSELLFKDITPTLIEDFRDYLLRAKSLRRRGQILSRNTALSYFNKVKATLKKAYNEGILRKDINAAVEGIKEQESQRNFLTMEEAAKLFKTPCKNDMVRRISIFSTLTGMRYSDIAKLTWGEVQYRRSEGYFIRFKQKKTENQQTLPISEEAFRLLGQKAEPSSKVFDGLKKWDMDRTLPIWIDEAGIDKHITFHCFRHSYATLQMAAGTDIFTVSKMLGHKDIKTTQIYTKIIDERKRETTSKISFAKIGNVDL